MVRKAVFSIAGITFSVTDPEDMGFSLGNGYKQFMTSKKPGIIVNILKSRFPEIKQIKRVFQGSSTWSLYEKDKVHILTVKSPETNTGIYRMCVFSDDFLSADFFIKDDGFSSYPFEYPVDEVFMVNLLSKGKGVLMHACGMDIDGDGVLFAGASGQGKSTMAKLLMDKYKILNDDRTIIRRSGKNYFIYGTPWHGEVSAVSPDRAPLKRVYFIEHAKNNKLTELSKKEAVSRLLACSFPTFWDKKGMEFTLDFCAGISEAVPCYRLGFVPDKKIEEFIP